MIEVTKYRCEMCGEEYYSPEVAKECEATHIPMGEQPPIILYRPMGYGTVEAAYPYAVVLTLADGKEYTFKR